MKKLATIIFHFSLFIFHFSVLAQQAIPDSGDRVMIGDFEYVLVKACDWCEVTSTVDRVSGMYASMNSTEDGRKMLHGKRGHTTVTNGTITVEYADGYTHTESVESNKVKRASNKAGKIRSAAYSPNRPDRLENLLKQREAIRRAKPIEVTVEVGGGK